MYMKNDYKNLSLEELAVEEENIFPKILKIRNEKFVRENMYNNKIITIDEHLNWVRNHLLKKTRKIFKIIFKEKLVGAIVLSNISTVNKESDWAFYLSKNAKTGLGALVEYKFLNFFFNNFDSFVLNCEVLEFNKGVISLHKKFGFEVKEIKESKVIRNNISINAVLMRLDKNKWQLSKDIIKKRLKI